MFRGSFSHTLDDKGRFSVPARYKDVIRASNGDTIMITCMDGCLVAYTLDVWGKIENRILSLAEKSESMRRFRRLFVGGAHECTCDKQGRVLIPPTLRADAALEKEIVLVGVLDHFEIWSQEKWAKEKEAMGVDMQQAEVRNEIAKLGL
jgi:MraZ protein